MYNCCSFKQRCFDCKGEKDAESKCAYTSTEPPKQPFIVPEAFHDIEFLYVCVDASACYIIAIYLHELSSEIQAQLHVCLYGLLGFRKSYQFETRESLMKNEEVLEPEDPREKVFVLYLQSTVATSQTLC